MTRQAMSPNDIAEFSRVFADHTNEELAEMFGVKRSLVEKYGSRLGLTKSKATKRRAQARQNPWSDEDIAYVCQHYPTGETLEIARRLRRSVGQVHKMAAKNGVTKTRGAKVEIARRANYVKHHHVQPAWGGGKPSDAHARTTAVERAKLPAVVPPNVKITRAPTPVDTRYAVDPGYVGPFSRAGIGRDVDTGRAWGQGA